MYGWHMTDCGKQLSANIPVDGNGITTKGLLLLLAIAPAFLVRYLQYGDLLMATGAAAAAIGILSVAATSLSEKASDLFWTAFVFFLIVIVCKSQPAFAAAAWGTWLVRETSLNLPLLGGNSIGTAPSARSVFAQAAASFVVASILIIWASGGTLTLWLSLGFAAVLLAVAAFVSRRLRSEVAAPLPELAAVTLLAGIFGFNPIYMLYGKPLLLSAAVAGVCAFLLYKVSLIGKTAVPAFALYGTIVYFALDTSGFAFFIVFLIICETGDKINKRPDNLRLMNKPGLFSARALPAILLAAVSVGWEDPFLFYLAFAGSLSAAAFMQWFPAISEKQSGGITGVKNFITGSVGASLMAICASLFNFIPSEAILIVLLAGVTPILTKQLTRPLAKPEKDAKYIPALLGAAAAAFLHNIILLH